MYCSSSLKTMPLLPLVFSNPALFSKSTFIHDLEATPLTICLQDRGFFIVLVALKVKKNKKKKNSDILKSTWAVWIQVGTTTTTMIKAFLLDVESSTSESVLGGKQENVQRNQRDFMREALMTSRWRSNPSLCANGSVHSSQCAKSRGKRK